MSGENLETSPSEPPTPKKTRIPLLIRITNLAVPIRLHIYSFLNENDIHCPEIYGLRRHEQKMDPCWTFSCLRRWDQERYEPYTIETAFASMIGDCDVLEYLQGMPSNPWTAENCNRKLIFEEDMQDFFYFLTVLIVGYNNIKTLRWAKQMMFPWNEWAFDAGVRYGVDLSVLQWMHKQGCPYSESTLGVAASWRNTDVLEWLINIKCPMSVWTCRVAIAANCKLDNLMWLRCHGCPWDGDVLDAATLHIDNLVIIKYLLEEKCPWNNATLDYIIRRGKVPLLKVFHEANVKFDESHFHLAIAFRRPIEILQYLLRCISSSWDASTFNLALCGENLSLLKWLKEEGCALSKLKIVKSFDGCMKRTVL
jgi:hypothetical protein